MTPEERAVEVCEQLGNALDQRGVFASILVSRVIAAAIRAAIAEEREACAKLAEKIDDDGNYDEIEPGYHIAEAIRARSQQPASPVT